MDVKGIENLLSQLRAAAATASGKPAAGTAAAAAGHNGFGELLKSSLDQVNATQQNAAGMAKNYELGASNVSLQDVMIAGAKANIAFQATVQVRNRLVSAYHDIMNMPV